MKVTQSKYYPKPNQWREVTINEVWLRDALSPLLKQMRYVASTSDVERIIVSDIDEKTRTYKLTFAVSRRKEV